ncbi:MAG TPA: GH1 family beta-glucosidase [Opitutaceae bacterium]|nr:GH1 family beta-glucosidase [Opitutaceae bacterium]
MNRVFPKKFVWGVAAAAPQIEGATREDGKGESVWDHFARQPGRIHNGDTLDVACDHYHRYQSDFALMRKLGVRHYRLSLAWPRIFPGGSGTINRKGLDFYDRLLDALLEEGITPWVTMFHWDLPQALEDAGGWRVRETPEAFARYADTIVRAYGDRVKRWITLNEMRCFTVLAYGDTLRPPGVIEPPQIVNQTYHHALLAHGEGVRAVREHGGRGAQVGLTDDSIVPVPVTETPENIAAAERAFSTLNLRSIDPIFRGGYSAEYFKLTGRDRARVRRGDFEIISQPTDFFGLNIYTGVFVRAGARGRAEQIPFPQNYPAADAAWLRLVPQAMYWGPRHARSVYGVKQIYITESGAGYDDVPTEKGEILDLHRREYVRQCLAELHRAIGDGAPVRGYFLWSFMDNFEWLDGYARRFGLCYTDYATQQRTPKLSAHWYSAVMRLNRLV